MTELIEPGGMVRQQIETMQAHADLLRVGGHAAIAERVEKSAKRLRKRMASIAAAGDTSTKHHQSEVSTDG